MATGDGAAQAAYFIEAVQPDANTLLAVDHEDPAVPLATLQEFCAAVSAACPNHLVIYSNNVIQKQLAGASRCLPWPVYRLVASHEITAGAPIWATATWPESYWLWQYGLTVLPGLSAPWSTSALT